MPHLIGILGSPIMPCRTGTFAYLHTPNHGNSAENPGQAAALTARLTSARSAVYSGERRKSLPNSGPQAGAPEFQLGALTRPQSLGVLHFG